MTGQSFTPYPHQQAGIDWLTELGFSYYRIKDHQELAAFEAVLLETPGRR